MRSIWTLGLFGKKTPARKPAGRPRARLGLEALEAREVPAVIVSGATSDRVDVFPVPNSTVLRYVITPAGQPASPSYYTDGSTPASVFTGEGNDEVVVWGPTPHTPVYYDGGPGHDVFSLAEVATATVHAGYVQSGGSQNLSHAGVEVLGLNGNAGNNNFVVYDRGVHTVVNGWGGYDALTLGAIAGAADVYNGAVYTTGRQPVSFSTAGDPAIEALSLQGDNNPNDFVIHQLTVRTHAFGFDGHDNLHFHNLNDAEVYNGQVNVAYNQPVHFATGGHEAMEAVWLNGNNNNNVFNLRQRTLPVIVHGNGGHDLLDLHEVAEANVHNGSVGLPGHHSVHFATAGFGAIEFLALNGDGGNNVFNFWDRTVGAGVNGWGGYDTVAVKNVPSAHVYAGHIQLTGHHPVHYGTGGPHAIERVQLDGTGGNDHLIVDGSVSAVAASLFGHHGDDALVGGSAWDYLDGGEGGDLLYGGAGNDTVLGGNGDDRLHGQGGGDHLNGGAHVNVAFGGMDGSFDTVASGGGKNFFLVTPGSNFSIDGLTSTPANSPVAASSAIVRFMNDGRAWAEHEVIDVSFGYFLLGQRTHSTRLAKNPGLGWDSQVIMRVPSLGGAYASNFSGVITLQPPGPGVPFYKLIRVADAAFQLPEGLSSWHILIHEVGHNWDEQYENPYGNVGAFNNLSGWYVNQNGEWRFPLVYANFVNSYAASNPYEDYAETLLAAIAPYLPRFHQGVPFNLSTASSKLNWMNTWLDTVRNNG